LVSSITASIRTMLGDQLKENQSLSRYSTARLGGIADGLLEITQLEILKSVYTQLYSTGFPTKLIGGGSNILISDEGYRGVILVNRCSAFQVSGSGSQVLVSCESGVNLGSLARKLALEGISGLEWAAGIPGSLGGAAYGNAGAHGSTMQNCIQSVELLSPDGKTSILPVDQMEYGYRTSHLKSAATGMVIMRVTFHLTNASVEEIHAKMDEFAQKRKVSQPTGACLGSIFKNPEHDYAGRLLEEAGLKGTQIGGVRVSDKHANFFINDPSATASDYYRLIKFAQQQVFDHSGILLEPEIEFLGEFSTGE
jgi:UDP-N-acetylmuramate dehydrogenase